MHAGLLNRVADIRFKNPKYDNLKNYWLQVISNKAITRFSAPSPIWSTRASSI
jgi:hypothetical protein